MSAVSRNTHDHQRAVSKPPAEWADVRIARITTETDGSGRSVALCSCGWDSKVCNRDKVREIRVDRHLNKRHGGQAIFL